MESNNTIKDQILTLFPDNNNKEISASDMRIFVHSIFNTKEDTVVKIETADDIRDNNTRIYYNSVVIIWNDVQHKGVYLSKANQPIDIVQLEKIAELNTSGTDPEPGTDLGLFMYNYNHDKLYSDANYFYSNGNIIKTELTTNNVRSYDIDYLYNNDNIEQISITDLSTNNTVHITFTFDGNDNIKYKVYTIIL